MRRHKNMDIPSTEAAEPCLAVRYWQRMPTYPEDMAAHRKCGVQQRETSQIYTPRDEQTNCISSSFNGHCHEVERELFLTF